MTKTPDIIKAAALFINEKGELLLSRDKGSTKWQVLGGKIEKNEKPVETIQREMKEELNLEVSVEHNQYAESPIFTAANDPELQVKLFYYFCQLQGQPELNENVEELHWFSKEEALSGNYDLAESTRKFLIPLLIEDKILK
ncbi:MAG: NUDIX domain-containing protein [bacterium]